MNRHVFAAFLLVSTIAAAGCAPGQTAEWIPNGPLDDAGPHADADAEGGADARAPADAGSDAASDVDFSDVWAPDAQLNDIGDAAAPPDTTTEPDEDAAPNEADTLDPQPPEPDITDPEPEPEPSWNCGTVACSSVDKTTALKKMLAVNGCAYELKLEKPLDKGIQLADKLLTRLQAESLGQRRSLSYVMDRLNRDARSGITSQSASRLSGLSAKGFRWNTGDDNVNYWYPQGITGSSDAAANGKVNGKKWLITAWYNKTTDRPTKGVRLALADISDLNNVKYRLLVLVDPYEESNGKANYKEAAYDGGDALHAGGIIWYGDYLYVADTSRGFRIYDLSRIFSPKDTSNKDKVGISGSNSHAFSYAYAVPRIARYRLTPNSCATRFSFIGLDRDSNPPAIVSGEYFADHHNGKLVTWPLNPTTKLLETRQGTTRASAAAIIGQTRAQGSLRRNGFYYVSSSSQDGSNGRLYKGKPGQTNTSVNWVYGAEDVYLQRDTGRIWTNAEHPGRRDVVSIPLP